MTRLFSYAVFAAMLNVCFLIDPTAAQSASPQSRSGGGTLRSVLASAALPSVADAPRYFKLVRVSVPPKQATTYEGPIGFILALNGSLEVTSGTDRQLLDRGDGMLIDRATRTTFKATGSQPAVFMHVVLLTAGELGKPMEGPPATITQLYRTASPIPGLKSGPYEFTFVRVTFPPAMAINRPHRRSGAAIYYIFSGTGMFTSGGKTESKPAGVAHYEPYDLVHQWANPGDTPLVLIQANISQEGVPAVIFAQDGDAAAPK